MLVFFRIFLFLFFSCFFFESVSEGKNEFFPSFSKIEINSDYFESQADIYYLKSEMSYYDNDTTATIDYLKEAIRYAPKSLHLRSRLASLYKEEGLYGEAIQQYLWLLDKKPQDIKTHQKIAQLYRLRDLNDKALKHYRIISKKDSSSFINQALLLAEEKKWEKSLSLLKKGDQKDGQNLLVQAYIYEQTKKGPFQDKVFKKVLNFKDGEEDFILKAAHFYTISKKSKQASELLFNYQKNHPRSLLVAENLFNLYISLGQTKEAYQQLQIIQDLGSLKNSHYFFMVSFLLSEEKYSEAIPFIRDLLEKEIASKDYYSYLLAASYEKNQDFEKALEAYKKISEESRYFVTAQVQKGQILKDRGEITKALSLLERVAFSSKPVKEIKPLLVYAQYLWDERQSEKSIEALTKGLRSFPDSIDILFLRGFYLGQLKQEEKSIKDMERVLKLDASHEEALNYMAYFYADKKQNLDKAEKLASRALSTRPTSSYFLDTLGWVFFQKGQYRKALTYFKEAFSNNPQDSYIAEHLGRAYYELKNFKKCEHFFKQALQLELNEKKRLQIKKRLASLQAYL